MNPRTEIIAAITAAEASSYEDGSRHWREDLRPAPRLPLSESWDRQGLEALVQSAMADFTQRTGVSLPPNLAQHGPWVKYPRQGPVYVAGPSRRLEDGTWCYGQRECSAEARQGLIEAAAKFAGWLRAVAHDPMVVRLLQKATSDRGMWSPSTTLNLWVLAGRWTPGALSRQLRQVRRRANEILHPYGMSVSWRALGGALSYGSRNTGKSARIAAAYTVSGLSPERETYRWLGARASRMFLTDVSRTAHARPDATDGVVGFAQSAQAAGGLTAWLRRTRVGAGDAPPVREPVPVLTRGAIRVWRMVQTPARPGKLPQRLRPIYLVVGPRGRTYHTANCWYSPDTAIQQARQAWRKQQDAQRGSRPLRFSAPVTVLVTRTASYEAGNCAAGTEAWIQRHAPGRWYVTAGQARASGDRRAEAAAIMAERAVRQMMAA